jgi:hypothetical protein
MYQTEATNQKSSSNPLGLASNLSPIAALIHDIEHMLTQAHEEASILENKVEPIRGTAPESMTGEGVAPRELPPTMMEQHLHNLHDTARYLTNRIRKINAELRI